MALFDPDGGYYRAARARIGKAGDFFTNPCVGATFGKVLASQFAECWELLGRPKRFDLVEQGGNDGALAGDILHALRENFSQAYAHSVLTLVEPFPALEHVQRERLAGHDGHVTWVGDLAGLSPITGVHYSNEFPDALPVRRLVCRQARWHEQWVDLHNGDFSMIELPLKDPQVGKSLPRDLPDGYLAEIRPRADEWVARVASRFNRGWMLIIDYGFSAAQLYAPWRTCGTLACYRGHVRDDNPLVDPGRKDITAHVDFSALADAARSGGMFVSGFTDQHHFLIAAGEPLMRQLENAPDSAERRKTLGELKMLLHPETMGTQFKYLALSKNVPESAMLSGFRYARTRAQLEGPRPGDAH